MDSNGTQLKQYYRASRPNIVEFHSFIIRTMGTATYACLRRCTTFDGVPTTHGRLTDLLGRAETRVISAAPLYQLAVETIIEQYIILLPVLVSDGLYCLFSVQVMG